MQMKYMYAENNHTYKRKPIKLSQVCSSNIAHKNMLQNATLAQSNSGVHYIYITWD